MLLIVTSCRRTVTVVPPRVASEVAETLRTVIVQVARCFLGPDGALTWTLGTRMRELERACAICLSITRI
jgi:hypothetical protein